LINITRAFAMKPTNTALIKARPEIKSVRFTFSGFSDGEE
jgi:hypothetical protein